MLKLKGSLYYTKYWLHINELYYLWLICPEYCEYFVISLSRISSPLRCRGRRLVRKRKISLACCLLQYFSKTQDWSSLSCLRWESDRLRNTNSAGWYDRIRFDTPPLRGGGCGTCKHPTSAKTSNDLPGLINCFFPIININGNGKVPGSLLYVLIFGVMTPEIRK